MIVLVPKGWNFQSFIILCLRKNPLIAKKAREVGMAVYMPRLTIVGV